MPTPGAGQYRDADLNIRIHIGCPKTGTTSLQQQLFRSLPGVHYMGHYSAVNPKLQKYIKRQMDAESARKQWQKSVAGADDNDRLVLYSHEKLTYCPASLAPEVAAKVREITGDAEILITIRSQSSVCVSNYFNYVATGYKHSFDTFMQQGLETLNQPPRLATAGSPEQIWGLWFYDQLMNAWSTYFSKVHVLPLEAWKTDPAGSREILAEFLDCPPDAIRLPTGKARSRATNSPLRRYLPKPLTEYLKTISLPRWLDQRLSQDMDITLTPEQMQILEQTYGQSNRQLAAQTGWDLARLGYPGMKQ